MRKPFFYKTAGLVYGFSGLLAGTLLAQESRHTQAPTVPGNHAATEAEFTNAIRGVDQFTSNLRQQLAIYQEHLQRAMELYGRGFFDPDSQKKLTGFDPDIRTGDPTQTEKIKQTVFASILMTSGIRLDPDPLHDWAEVEKTLDSYQAALDQASSVNAATNVWNATSQDNMSVETLRKLKGQWKSAAREAEQEHGRAAGLRPVKLSQGQTFSAKAAEGMNLHFTLLGVQFGRDMGNVNAFIQLTYSGQTGAGHIFLLTALNTAEEKTRTDTWIRSRTLLIYSNAEHSAQYGHVVTAQDHGDYRVLGARIADVAPTVHDWIWKSLAPPHAPAATLPELESAVRRVQDNQHAIDAAVDEFQQLSLKAVQANDDALIAAASVTHGKAQLPEQDLKFYYPDVRARLYAVRALSAGDPRFLTAAEAVKAARAQAEIAVREGSERFGYFNGIATYAAPELPWKDIQKLAVRFMNVAEEVRRAGERADESLPRTLKDDEAAVTSRLSLVVEQVNRGQQQADQKTSLMSERMLREVHWAVKGIPRREYSSEVIEISPTGLHQVQSVSKTTYIQGPGGIGQTFQDLSKGRAAAF